MATRMNRHIMAPLHQAHSYSYFNKVWFVLPLRVKEPAAQLEVYGVCKRKGTETYSSGSWMKQVSQARHARQNDGIDIVDMDGVNA